MPTAEASAPAGMTRRLLPLALAALVFYIVFLLFVPFFVPLFWGAVLAVIFHPVYRRLNRLLGHRGTLSALLLAAAILVLVLLPALTLLYELVSRTIDYIQKAQAALAGQEAFSSPQSFVNVYVWPYAGRLGLTPHDVRQAVTFGLRTVADFAMALGSSLAGNLLGLLLNIFFTLVTLYYALKDGPQFVAHLIDLSPLPREETEGTLRRLREVMHASVLSTIVVAALQGAAGGFFFWVLGLPDALFWGVVMGTLSLIPILGAFVVWIPAAIYLAVIGDYFRAAALTAAGAIVINAIDNFARPYLIQGRVGINNFYLIFGIVGGIFLFGFTGLLAGPLVVSLVFIVFEVYEKRRGGAGNLEG
ncbi:MAG: AI-2E family transporter [Pseudomonadota bacterium]